MQTTTHADRRHDDRRAHSASLGDRGMRCASCGARWYSAIAGLTAQWARCASCGGPLHAERRSGRDRRVHASCAAA